MEVIATHVATDFDALASMVACSRLHPQGQMVLPGTVRHNVRQFLSLHKDSFSFWQANQMQEDKVSVLYIVDADSCRRLGELSHLCEQAGKIVYYDHHPGQSEGEGIREQLGATVTILVELLKQKQIEISSLEATLFLLGIYEDTNCLTNSGTTPRDLQAAAWLLKQGAVLTEVNKYVKLSFSPDQRQLFEQLLAASQTITVNGRTVVIACTRVDEYIGGLGRITQRLAELEGGDIAITITSMEDRVYLVGRSILPEIDLTVALADLSVKGHGAAVAATFRDTGIDQLASRVKEALQQQLTGGISAAAIMSTPVKSIPDNTTIQEANRLMLRYGHTGLPVVDQNQRLVGIVSRRDVDKAVRHDLGHAPVRGYMTKNVVTVSPQATWEEITRAMTQHDIGRLPVLDRGKLVGIITRTDVLRQVHGDSTPSWHRPLFNSRDYQLAEPMENITGLVNSRLPKRIQGLLLLLGQKADKEGFKAYVVGGFVRDLVLGVPNYDLDLVVEENAIKFARTLPPLIGGRLHEHQEFGTATLTLPDGYQVDFATARLEFYQFPAAAPEVEQTTIKHDLYRRDFTINTLGFCLNSSNFGSFLDFFNGYDDIKRGVIRVLYNLSFVEDPTRILRAIRFAGRYGFEMEEQTKTFLLSAIKDDMLSKVSPARMGGEFSHLFQEANVPVLIDMTHNLGALEAVLPGMDYSQELQQKMQAAARVIQWNQRMGNILVEEAWQVYAVLLLESLPAGQRPAAAERLGLTIREARDVLAVCKQLAEISTSLGGEAMQPSSIYNILQSLPVVGLLSLLAANHNDATVKARVMLYLDDLADMELEITGHDLVRLGCEPGPRLGRLLDSVRRARLDGKVNTREEQLNLAERLLNDSEEE